MDVDECALGTDNCHDNAKCTNIVDHYSPDPTYSCACYPGYEGDGKTCEDINECTNANICAENATCKNFLSTYECTCNDGFWGDGKEECSPTGTCKMYHNGGCKDAAVIQTLTDKFRTVEECSVICSNDILCIGFVSVQGSS